MSEMGCVFDCQACGAKEVAQAPFPELLFVDGIAVQCCAECVAELRDGKKRGGKKAQADDVRDKTIAALQAQLDELKKAVAGNGKKAASSKRKAGARTRKTG